MAKALDENLALETASTIGAEWQRRRWHVELPNPSTATVDRQAGYMRVVADGINSVSASGKTGLYTGSSVLTKFSRLSALGTVRFFLSSSLDQASVFGPLPTRGYGVKISNGAPQLVKVSAGAESVLGTSVGVAPNTLTNIYWVRLQRTGTQVQFRIWQDGNVEPGSWDVQVTESALASGGTQITVAPAAFELDIYSYQFLTPTGSLVSRSLPLTFRGLDGRRLPSGSITRGQSDDCLYSAPPAFVTSAALTYDSTRLRRILTAPGNSTVTVALDGFDVTSVKSFRTGIRGLTLAELASGCRVIFGFVSGGNTWGIKQANSDAWCNLMNGAGSSSMNGVDLLNGNTAPINFEIEVNFRSGQIYIWMGDQQLDWYANFNTVPNGVIVPTLSLQATSATPVTAKYSQFDEWLETHSSAA